MFAKRRDVTTTDIGRYGERVAAEYLKKNGYKILEQNNKQSHNELDIIAADKDYLVFVEVKTRSVYQEDMYSPYGSPASAVTKDKQRRTLAAARSYMVKNRTVGHTKKQPRMDVIEIYLDKYTQKVIKINHIIDAFRAN